MCVCVVCVWVSITREGRRRRTNRRPSAGRRSFCLRATARSAPRPHLPAHMRARACVSGWRQTLCYFVSCGDLGGVKITYPYLCACAVCANEEMYASSIQAWSLGRSQCRERRREGGAGGKHLHVGAAGISLQSLVCARHSPQVLVLHHTTWIIRCRYRQRFFGYACVPTATS